MPDNPAIILSFICDRVGTVLSVIRDDAGIIPDPINDINMRDLVDSASESKVWRFLAALQKEKAAAEWSFNLNINGKLETLQFDGGMVQDRLVVVASTDADNAQQYYEELMKISNENANALRAVMKDYTLLTRQENVPRTLYQEMMALNNELTNTQRELAKKNHELAHINMEKNHYLGMAAHDMRTPLDVILGYSEFLREEWEFISNNERDEVLNKISESIHFMLSLINELLDYSKIESGTLHLNLEATSITGLLKMSMEQVRPQAARKNIKLVLEETRGLPEIVLDVYRTSQVVLNLLTNAIKFSMPSSEIRVRAVHEGDNMRLEIQDSGLGIPPEEIEQLFQPFAQTSVKPTAGEKSTGLGLLIVKRIVTAHRGRVEVHSEVGQGSTFSVILPLQPPVSNSEI